MQDLLLTTKIPMTHEVEFCKTSPPRTHESDCDVNIYQTNQPMPCGFASHDLAVRTRRRQLRKAGCCACTCCTHCWLGVFTACGWLCLGCGPRAFAPVCRGCCRYNALWITFCESHAWNTKPYPARLPRLLPLQCPVDHLLSTMTTPLNPATPCASPPASCKLTSSETHDALWITSCEPCRASQPCAAARL